MAYRENQETFCVTLQMEDDNAQFSTSKFLYLKMWVLEYLRVPFFGPLLFLIYINGLSKGLLTSAKVFTDNAYLFTSACNLNENLEIINKWATQAMENEF